MILVSGATKTWPHYRGPLQIGQLVSPRAGNAIWADRWAVDNDAFSAAGFDRDAFMALLGRLAGKPGCLFVAAPDVVADARATLDRFEAWEPIVVAYGLPVALVGQDGAESLPIPWDRMSAWFVGGSDAFKLSRTAADLTAEAKRRGLWTHMGRVNTASRFRHAWEDGYDSIDGTGWSKFADAYVERGERWMANVHPVLF